MEEISSTLSNSASMLPAAEKSLVLIPHTSKIITSSDSKASNDLSLTNSKRSFLPALKLLVQKTIMPKSVVGEKSPVEEVASSPKDSNTPRISKTSGGKKSPKNPEKIKSDEIEKYLKEEKKKFEMLAVEPKILILGSSDCGKSTLMKQLKILHGNGFTVEEMYAFKKGIIKNIMAAVLATGILIKEGESIVVSIDDECGSNISNLSHIASEASNGMYREASVIQVISAFYFSMNYLNLPSSGEATVLYHCQNPSLKA
jgi:G-protein alpha subunit